MNRKRTLAELPVTLSDKKSKKEKENSLVKSIRFRKVNEGLKGIIKKQ